MELAFTKMEGLGNDFIMIDDRDQNLAGKISYPDLAKKLCSRHFGIGADGIIIILNSLKNDIGFKIFNPDGSEAEMCGNGMRCFAKFVFEKKIVTKKRFTVETLAGTIVPEILPTAANKVQAVCVDLGEPVLLPDRIPFKSDKEKAIDQEIQANGKKICLTAVSVGTPHAVIFVDDVEKIDLEKQGREIEIHERFPEKTNVEFIQVLNDHELKMRVWERGAGETLACGTGASAAVVAAFLKGLIRENAIVHLAGGDLSIHWDQKNRHILKTGPATLVFTGTIKI